MEDADRRARAEARRRIAIIRKSSLRPVEDDPSPIFGAAAVSLVWRLTQESWALAGRELPSYRRHEIPCRFVPGRPT